MQLQTETFHEWGKIHQYVVSCRQGQAHDSRQHEDRESNEVGASDLRVSTVKVPGDIQLAKQEENGRDEVRIDIDRLVLDIRSAAERSVSVI